MSSPTPVQIAPGSDTGTEAAPDDTAQEAIVDHYIAAMQRQQQQMATDREEIPRLQAETRAILDDVRTILRSA